jgi:hypothetical protein
VTFFISALRLVPQGRAECAAGGIVILYQSSMGMKHATPNHPPKQVPHISPSFGEMWVGCIRRREPTGDETSNSKSPTKAGAPYLAFFGEMWVGCIRRREPTGDETCNFKSPTKTGAPYLAFFGEMWLGCIRRREPTGRLKETGL